MKKVMKAVAAVMLSVAVFCAAGCNKPDAPNNGNNNGGNGGNNNGGFLDGYEYVDLGLPSGTLWAACNVGATTPDGYGHHFAWGETTPKDTYNSETYKWFNGHCELTKYCNKSSDGYNGFTDNLTVLQPSDDAATANWGGGWRMPTYEEWVELYQNTTNTWTTRNAVGGRLFTASNGNSLFLPAAGINNLHYVDCGYYWSSSLNTEQPTSARFLHFDSYQYDAVELDMWDEVDRVRGFSVRPVREN